MDRTASIIDMKQFAVQGLGGQLHTVHAADAGGLFDAVSAATGVPQDQLRLTQAGKDVRAIDLDASLTVWVWLRVQGGKGGGFGTLLRGQGMIVRVDNFEDCRDLSGRRIRDVNNEIRMGEWEKRKQEEAKLLKTSEPLPPVTAKPKAAPVYRSEVKDAATAMKDAVRAAVRKRKASELPEDQPTKRAAKGE